MWCGKIISMPKLTKKISSTSFFISHFLILIVSLTFLFGLYFVLNLQYQITDNPFASGPVTSKPKSFTLDLEQPGDDSLIFQSSVIVSGKTGPQMEVLITTDTQDKVIQSKNDGTFSHTLQLDQGVNNIKVVVFDSTGDTRIAERTIYYSKEKI